MKDFCDPLQVAQQVFEDDVVGYTLLPMAILRYTCIYIYIYIAQLLASDNIYLEGSRIPAWSFIETVHRLSSQHILHMTLSTQDKKVIHISFINDLL